MTDNNETREAVKEVAAKLKAQGKTDAAAALLLAYEWFENDDFRAKFTNYMYENMTGPNA